MFQVHKRHIRYFSTKVQNFINGEFVDSNATEWFNVYNPATDEIIAKTPQSTNEELNEATQIAHEAFQEWRNTSVMKRQRYMFDYLHELNNYKDKIAENIVLENGKSLADAHGDVFRGIEVVERSTSVVQDLMGETVEQLAQDTDCYSYRQPLGVSAGICPFNFPAMIPLWMFPLALSSGNTFVMKPSERTPGAAMIMAEIAQNINLPKGILNIIHGGKDTVNFICDDPRIKTISFVGGNQAGEHIHQRGTSNDKRVQSNMGAKNHAIIMPDANKESALNMIAGASFGATGQRCMALPVAIFVGPASDWIPELVEKAKSLKIGPGSDKDADLGPMITKESLQRAESIINAAEQEGASILLDGRGVKVEGYENGYFLGPTIIDHSKPGQQNYDQEIFGPVISCVRVNTLEEGIELINKNKYGNGTAIFTQSGAVARKFQYKLM